MCVPILSTFSNAQHKTIEQKAFDERWMEKILIDVASYVKMSLYAYIVHLWDSICHLVDK